MCRACGGNARFHAQDGTSDLDSATSNVTDLRRARQRARESVRELGRVIKVWLARRGFRSIEQDIESPSARQRLNDQITQLAEDSLATDLVDWLYQRRRITMGRAARQAFTDMQQVLDAEPFGRSDFSAEDRALNQVMRNIDAGLLNDLSEEVGDRITRQIRMGFRQDFETVEDIGRRVDYVLTTGTTEDPDRAKTGVEGQTIKSKGELIAHDSIQDGYTTAARRRYLQNGFRYARFDAVIDTATSAVCRRMNGELIDIVQNPFFIPPLHPWCRSDILPVLDPEGEQPLTRDSVADDFLGTIRSTKSYRPPAMQGDEAFQPTALTQNQSP